MDKEKKEEVWSNRLHPIIEDMGFQRSQWVFERLAWCGLYLVILLAILGLFSEGPISVTTAGSDGSQLQLEYQRFYRNGALFDMTISLSVEEGSAATLRFNSEFIEAFTIEDMRPHPLLSHSSVAGIDFVFHVGQTEQMQVYLSLRPRQLGPIHARVSLNDHKELPFSVFVYP